MVGAIQTVGVSEDFESGTLGSAWSTSSSTRGGRIRVEARTPDGRTDVRHLHCGIVPEGADEDLYIWVRKHGNRATKWFPRGTGPADIDPPLPAGRYSVAVYKSDGSRMQDKTVAVEVGKTVDVKFVIDDSD